MNVRSAWRRLFPAGPAVIGAGPGRGLRFDVGGGNPDFAAGTYEPPVQQALADCLKPGDVVLDVGANVGFIAVIAAKLVGPAGRVVAFEPVPENARLVRRNARLNGLSRLGSNPIDILRRNIPGYTKLNENQEPLPRTFGNYE